MMTSIENSADTQKPQDVDLLSIENLRMYFPIEAGFFRQVVGNVRAVDDVSLTIPRGKTLGLVGESGSGKTTLGRCVVRALKPTSGAIHFNLNAVQKHHEILDNTDGLVDLAQLPQRDLRPYRRLIQMVFQDPYSSLDPRKTVFDIVSEPIRINRLLKGKALEERVQELLETVGLSRKHMKRYPHAFSGGQRQRLGIARALSINPELIVCDEPVSALDVSVQAQVLNLLMDLQEELNLTYLFIAHDLSVVEHISHEVAVMYVGKIVERAHTDDLFSNPKHPYTHALLKSVPRPDPSQAFLENDILEGELPDPANPPQGCYFHPRCPFAKDICRSEIPVLEEVSPGHFSACHFANELELTL